MTVLSTCEALLLLPTKIDALEDKSNIHTLLDPFQEQLFGRACLIQLLPAKV